MRRAPLLRVVLALAAGILLAEYLPSLPVGLLCLVAAVAVALMAVALPMKRRGANFLFTFLLWLVLVVVGWLLGILHATDPAQGLPAEGWGTKDKNLTTLVATLTDTPRSAPRTYKVTAHVDAVCCDTVWKAADCRIMLYLAKDSASGSLRYGDRLLLRARPQLPNDAQNPGQFDYRRHLLHKGIGWQAFVRQGEWKSLPAPSDCSNGLVVWSKQTQTRLVERIQSCRRTPA